MERPWTLRELKPLPSIVDAVVESLGREIGTVDRDEIQTRCDEVLETIVLAVQWPMLREMLRLQGFDADPYRQTFGHLLHVSAARRLEAERARSGNPVSFDNPTG